MDGYPRIADQLQQIGWIWPPAPLAQQWIALLTADPCACLGRIIAQHRTHYLAAQSPTCVYPVTESCAPSHAQTALARRAVVGDWVLINPKTRQIWQILPPHTTLKRGMGDARHQQILATNVTVCWIVCALDRPWNPRRIERLIVLVRSAGITPLIVLTKADLVHQDVASLTRWQQTLGLEHAIVVVHAQRALACAELQAWLVPGQTIVLTGASGAGKSTLTNALLGEPRMRTQAVRASDGRGRHTTTQRALVCLPGGACLIDTPGIRELRPTGEENLQETFADIAALSRECRFRNCQHHHDEGCAVRHAVAIGQLSAMRLAHFHKLQADIHQIKQAHGAKKRK